MSGLISAGGLITGLDSGSIIQQLMSLERQPITRAQTRITSLQSQQTAIRELRTQLTTLRNSVQDFRLNNVFDKFLSSTSEETVLTSQVNSPSPVVGSFVVNVTQLASATTAQSSAKLGSAINPAATLNSSGIATDVEAGTFTINGVQFTVNPASDSLNTVLNAINASAAGVTATYDGLTDKVTIENDTPGDTSLINFGAGSDTSNLLSALSLNQATQTTGGGGQTTVTGTRNLGAVTGTVALNTESFANGAVTTGTFSINGVSITVDPTTDSLQEVIARINESDAQVTASFDSATDTIRFTSKTLGSRTINYGGGGDTSNFLSVTNLSSATQTAGSDSTFTINGGPALTRNTNEITDAISGVTISLLSTGTSTVTVSSENDAIVEQVQGFITAYNDTVDRISNLTNTGGLLPGDSGVRSILTFIRDKIFSQVPGAGEFDSVFSIGISTGKEFDINSTGKIELDEDKFREALTGNRTNVERLFANTSENGVADLLFGYLDDVTKSTGFLNERAKANGGIDTQVRNLRDQIARIEDRLVLKENRLRRQFSTLEQLSAGFQQQSAALSRIGF
jgi:flagellar hook-associated protein 2